MQCLLLLIRDVTTSKGMPLQVDWQQLFGIYHKARILSGNR
jgi:hypothetical protein